MAVIFTVMVYAIIVLGLSVEVTPAGSSTSIICVTECDQQTITCQEVTPIEDAFRDNAVVVFCNKMGNIYSSRQYYIFNVDIESCDKLALVMNYAKTCETSQNYNIVYKHD